MTRGQLAVLAIGILLLCYAAAWYYQHFANL